MIAYRLLFVQIILLLVNFSSGQKTLVSRAVHDIHQRAVRRTHNLARDLRIAFGGVLISRASGDAQHVVYCKRGSQSPFVNGGGSGNVSTATSGVTATATQSGSNPTATTTAASPWKLANAYVCHNALLTWFST